MAHRHQDHHRHELRHVAVNIRQTVQVQQNIQHNDTHTKNSTHTQASNWNWSKCVLIFSSFDNVIQFLKHFSLVNFELFFCCCCCWRNSFMNQHYKWNVLNENIIQVTQRFCFSFVYLFLQARADDDRLVHDMFPVQQLRHLKRNKQTHKVIYPAFRSQSAMHRI